MSKKRAMWHRKQRGLNITRLMARDGSNCSICGGPLDPKKRTGQWSRDPDQISFDHIVPRSSGGLTKPDNLRLAHARCNWERGNDPLIEDDATANPGAGNPR